MAAHLALCNRAADHHRAARDIVDAIDPRMTDEEMQAAWAMIRYHKRIEAIAQIEADHIARHAPAPVSQLGEVEHA